MTNRRPSLSGSRYALATCDRRRYLAATSSFDHGSSSFSHGRQLTTTKGTDRRSLRIEHDHRRLESGKRLLWYRASKGSVWLCQRPPDNDQGMSLPILRR